MYLCVKWCMLLLLSKCVTLCAVCCVLLQVNSAFVVNLHYAFQSSDKLYLIMDLMNGRGWGNQRVGWDRMVGVS